MQCWRSCAGLRIPWWDPYCGRRNDSSQRLTAGNRSVRLCDNPLPPIRPVPVGSPGRERERIQSLQCLVRRGTALFGLRLPTAV